MPTMRWTGDAARGRGLSKIASRHIALCCNASPPDADQRSDHAPSKHHPITGDRLRIWDAQMRKGNSDWPKLVETRKYSFPTFSDVWLFQGIARTQSPIQKNYALESPAFEVIAAVNLTKVQWKGLTPDRLRSWSKFSPCQVSMLIKDPKKYLHSTIPHNEHSLLLAWDSRMKNCGVYSFRKYYLFLLTLSRQ